MARPKKPSEKLKISSKLLEALNFLNTVTKDEGAPFETHIALHNKQAYAFNGTIAVGTSIDEEITAAPHCKTFIQALSKCGEQYAITQMENTLVIKSGKFKAIVPCIDINLLGYTPPDNPVAVIDDRLKPALEAMEIIKVENGQRVELLSFLLNGQSVISTDGKIILEYWHGIDLPSNMPIPKSIIPTILKNNKKLLQFGFSHSSVTFYFEDGSWIKSQLYAHKWPDVERFMTKLANLVPIPVDFYKALEAVVPFSENGSVYFERELLSSHKAEGAGATYEVAGLPKGPIYTAKYLAMIKPYVETIDFTVPGPHGSYMLMFMGKQCRGVIAGHG